MPVLNSRGDALAGIDGIVSVNGLPVYALAGAPAGGWRFLTDDTIGGQAFIGGAWSLYQVDRWAGAQELKRIDGAGANDFRAGGQQWLAYTTPPPFVRGTIAGAVGEHGLYDLGRDGVGVIKDDKDAERGCRVVTAHGSHAFPDDVWIAYQDGFLLTVASGAGLTLTSMASGERTVIPDLGVRGGRICAAGDGAVYQIFYWRGYTVVQRLGTFMGWPIRFSEFDFNPDVVAPYFSADTLIAATAKHAGERPEDTQKYTIDLTVAPIDLRNLYPPIIMPPVEDVAAVARPMFIGPYQFNTFVEGRRR